MNINPELETLANKIINKANIKNDNYAIDPITVIIIIGVILSLIRVIQECRRKRKRSDNKSEALDLRHTIVELAIKDSFINRYRLNKILKQHLSKKQYQQYGAGLQRSIIETAQNLTDNESLTLLEVLDV